MVGGQDVEEEVGTEISRAARLDLMGRRRVFEDVDNRAMVEDFFEQMRNVDTELEALDDMSEYAESTEFSVEDGNDSDGSSISQSPATLNCQRSRPGGALLGLATVQIQADEPPHHPPARENGAVLSHPSDDS